jgi:hypothetical protein
MCKIGDDVCVEKIVDLECRQESGVPIFDRMRSSIFKCPSTSLILNRSKTISP